MKSVPFPGSNLQIGKGQPEYNALHAMQVPGPEGELIMCFELTDEEIEQLKQTKRIYYHRWTFGQACNKCGTVSGFQPMRLDTDLANAYQFINDPEEE